jgi:hypothetical protein
MAPDLPPRSSNYASHHIENADRSSVDRFNIPFSTDESQEVHEDINEISSDDDQRSTSVYDNVYRYDRNDSEPPVLMPVRNGLLESYLNPVLTIFHQIPSLRKDIYQYQFETLGFHPRWFKGDPVRIAESVTQVKQDNEIHDLSFLLEVQRIFGFLDGDSKRAFTSVINFVRSFPREAKQKFQEVDSLREAYEVFVESLVKQLEQVGVKSPGSYFQNVATDSNTGESRPFSVFNIEAEEIQKDIYKTVHSVLWQEQFISTVADIITFTFEPSFEDGVVPERFELSEKFYPQIYTASFKPVLDELKEQRDNIEEERRETYTELMKTRAFKGKQVLPALAHSIEFLSIESQNTDDDESLKDALQDLQNIELSTTTKREQLMKRQSELLEAKHQLSPNNIPALLKKSPVELEPYLLTGVILSPVTFAYVKRNKSLVDDSSYSLDWYLVEYKPEEMDDFKIVQKTFDEIKRIVYSATGLHFRSSFVLTYVKESKFLADVEATVPQAVQDFIAKDKEELIKSLELILSSSSSGGETDSDENMDYDSDYEDLGSGKGSELIQLDENEDLAESKS